MHEVQSPADRAGRSRLRRIVGYSGHMTERTPPFRTGFWLPFGAAITGLAMVALGFLALRAAHERDELALDGRVLGLAHAAETALRERGVEEAATLLEPLLREAEPDVMGIRLLDVRGREIVRLGDLPEGAPRRTMVLFLGPGGRRGPGVQGLDPSERRKRAEEVLSEGGELPRPGGGPPWARQGGGASGGAVRPGGRYTMEVVLRPGAGQPPLTTRLVLPAAVAAAVAVFLMALVTGRLLERQQIQIQEEAQRRRMEALGRAGAGLAHQLRTPLATIKGSLQMMTEGAADAAQERRLTAAVAQAERMERMLGLLLDFARPPEPEAERVAVRGLLEEVVSGRPGVRLSAPEDLEGLVDREHLVQILENLVENALEASPEGSPVEVSASGDGSRVRIVVADRGAGPGEDPEILFEPYVTGRADGTGLGLTLARNLAEANGGSLRLVPREGGGTEAVLELPETGGAA